MSDTKKLVTQLLDAKQELFRARERSAQAAFDADGPKLTRAQASQAIDAAKAKVDRLQAEYNATLVSA